MLKVYKHYLIDEFFAILVEMYYNVFWLYVSVAYTQVFQFDQDVSQVANEMFKHFRPLSKHHSELSITVNRQIELSFMNLLWRVYFVNLILQG
jgi:hypothetical protein